MAATVRRPLTILDAVRFTAALLVVKVTISVVLQYRDYWPPNFNADFLLGRAEYFWGWYHLAFYLHLAAGPLALLAGTVLVSDRFRQRFPRAHRLLGRVQVVNIALCVVPSGFAMAFRPQAGPIAGLGLASLAVVTWITVFLGWRAAVQRRFEVHRRWMWRCYLALCSTVILRLMNGLTTVTNVEAPGLEIAAPWISWLAPLAVYELSLLWSSGYRPRRALRVWGHGGGVRHQKAGGTP